MKKDSSIEIVKDFHEKSLPEIVEREIDVKFSATKKVISIIGPRRAGKTYFLFDTVNRLVSQGISKQRTLYINLEDDRLLPLRLEDLDLLLKTYYEIYPENKRKKIFFFLDEVQNLDNWEIFVRRILDNENIQIFVTGSSSKLLSKEIATSLRGRAISYAILPFSFREFLKARGFKVEKYLSSGKKSKLLNLMLEYLKFGGFPEVVLESDDVSKIKILKEYIEVMPMRDVIERYKVKNVKILRMLLNGLLNSFSKEFSIHKFFNFLKSQGIKVSKNTLYNYLQYFEDAFIIMPLRKFSYSLREIEQSLPKVYPIDMGLISQFEPRFSNMGRLMENVVGIELLRKKCFDPLHEFYYWKDSQGKEVDFVLKEGARVKRIIQVCYDIEDYDTKQREIKALFKASEDLRCKNLLILTWDFEGEEEHWNKMIKFKPLWKWLLLEEHCL
jgi:hypothetical protein